MLSINYERAEAAVQSKPPLSLLPLMYEQFACTHPLL
jgi:hypothetical protein